MTVPARNASPPGPRRPRRRSPARRRWGRWLVGCLSVAVLATAGGGHLLISRLTGGIDRVDAFAGLDHRPRHAGGTNFLVVGTDGRDKLTAAEKREYRLGGAPCHCTDTIMVVHLSGSGDRASVVSIPRDSYAEIPRHTDPASGVARPAHRQRINTAYAEGGPTLTVRTVEHMTRVHIDHYLEVDFTSFMRTVDVLGGVRVCTPRPLKDAYTGLDLSAGSHELDGGEALRYVRSRHVDGAADLSRMRRQQRFLAAVIDRATKRDLLRNPMRFKKVASTVLDSVRADRGLGGEQLLELGSAMRHFSPASSEFASVPIRDPGHRVPGVGATVQWDRDGANALFNALRADRPLAERRRPSRSPDPAVPVPPKTVRVQVVNGTDRAGLGRRTDAALRATGFDTTGAPTNPAPGSEAVPRPRHTVIAYDPGWDRSARALRAALPGSELREVPGQGRVMRVTIGDREVRVRRVRSPEPATPSGRGGDATAVRGDEVSCR